jgi:hypothetical protein
MLVGFSRQLQIRIAKAPQSFEAQAKVIDMKVGLGMGLAFVSSTTEQKKVLGNWIVELGGKLPTPPQGRGDTAKDNDTVSGEVFMGDWVRLLQMIRRRMVHCAGHHGSKVALLLRSPLTAPTARYG